MLEHSERVLKIACLILAVLLVCQTGRVMSRRDPLARLKIPSQPALPASPSPQPERKGINSAALPSPGKPSTNTAPAQESKKTTNAVAPPNPVSGVINPGLRPGPGRKGPDLPPAIQSRVERIAESELLGPVIRPLPMALLGIAGDVAFLRAPNGQTGLPKEGDELGGIKLLRIGTNRVLIEHEGQQKELLMFSGYGGESLLPKSKDNPQ